MTRPAKPCDKGKGLLRLVAAQVSTKMITIVPMAETNENNGNLMLRYLDEMREKDEKFLRFVSAGKSTKRAKWIRSMWKGLRSRPTKAERKVGEYLIRNGVRIVFQRPFVINDKVYFADFFLPKTNIVIEVDGTEHERAFDYFRDADFKSIGIRVVRVSNTEAYSASVLSMKLGGIK